MQHNMYSLKLPHFRYEFIGLQGLKATQNKHQGKHEASYFTGAPTQGVQMRIEQSQLMFQGWIPTLEALILMMANSVN